MLEPPNVEHWTIERRVALQVLGLTFVIGFIVGMIAMLILFGILSL